MRTRWTNPLPSCKFIFLVMYNWWEAWRSLLSQLIKDCYVQKSHQAENDTSIPGYLQRLGCPGKTLSLVIKNLELLQLCSSQCTFREWPRAHLHTISPHLGVLGTICASHPPCLTGWKNQSPVHTPQRTPLTMSVTNTQAKNTAVTTHLQQRWPQNPSGEPAFSSSQHRTQCQRPSKSHWQWWPTAPVNRDKSPCPPTEPQQSLGLLFSPAHSTPCKYSHLEFFWWAQCHPLDLRSLHNAVRKVLHGSLPLDNGILSLQPGLDSLSS